MRFIFGLCMGIVLVILILMIDWHARLEQHRWLKFIYDRSSSVVEKISPLEKHNAKNTQPDSLPAPLKPRDEIPVDLPFLELEVEEILADSSATTVPKRQPPSQPGKKPAGPMPPIAKDLSDAEYRSQSRELMRRSRGHYARILRKDSTTRQNRTINK